VRFGEESHAKRRRTMNKTVELEISKANLEASLTENFLRQMGHFNGEVEDVQLTIADMIPIKITYKELVN
jgi:hypothetical protein